MQKSELLFEDHAEHYYSSVTYDRFYEVVARQDQLARLLMSAESLRMLQEESRHYQRTVYASLAGPLLLSLALGRLLSLGKAKTAAMGAAAVGGAVWWANSSCREKLVALKQRIYTENRPNFRKYELTGDIQLANPRVALVEEQ